MITDNEFQRIVKYVKSRYGIELGQKRVLIIGRLENYLIKNGYQNYDEYMTLVEKNPGGGEATDLINVLTTNHTYFMREFKHYEYMRDVILPYMKQREEQKKDLRIWSAAAATGEEPYTMAMVLKDFFGLEKDKWDTKILATDISTRVLESARRGIYSKGQIEQLPEQWKRRYFVKQNAEEYMVSKELKEEIIFRQFNLMDYIPFKRPFHIIFLRNVMIYFDEKTKRQLLDRIYEFMEPGGYLIIGSTETIDKRCTQFHYLEPSIYRK